MLVKSLSSNNNSIKYLVFYSQDFKAKQSPAEITSAGLKGLI